MNAPTPMITVAGTCEPGDWSSPDLADLPSPGRLARPARLYGVVLDKSGHPGARNFLANLPEGAAVFALAAPGVTFLLHEHAAPSALPLVSKAPLDAAAIDAWYAALLSAPGLPHGDAEAVPLAPGERRAFSAGASVTARQIVWLQAEAPILVYPAAAGAKASPATSRLVLANQIRAELVGDGEVQAIDTATLVARHPPATLGELSAEHAQRIAAVLIRRDAARRQRWRLTRQVDEIRASHAVQRLRDIAAFRRSAPVPAARPDQDPLPGVLAVIAAIEGFELRMPLHDKVRASLFERLKAYGIVSGFRFREIALDGRWWKQDSPPFIALDAETGSPLAVVFRRRRWRIVDPATLAETVIDEKAAARMKSAGYMLYPSLPDKPSGRDIWRFSTFAVGGDIRRLLVTSAAASLAALLMPVATGAILGVAIPDGRFTLLGDMLLLLLAAAVGSAGFQVARALSLIRLGTHVDQRLQAAIWDRVLRLAHVLLPPIFGRRPHVAHSRGRQHPPHPDRPGGQCRHRRCLLPGQPRRHADL